MNAKMIKEINLKNNFLTDTSLEKLFHILLNEATTL